jgi:hypothetical protein
MNKKNGEYTLVKNTKINSNDCCFYNRSTCFEALQGHDVFYCINIF